LIISTKGRYGLRAMFALALHGQDEPLSIKFIADNQNISELYLEQLFSRLKSAKLIKSVRGAQGGYLLGVPPGDITVGSIIRALEGPLAPSDCVVEDSIACQNAESCVTRVVWQRIYDGLNNVVDSITLQDMLNELQLKSNLRNTKC
jgi:Rrf2 family protein